MTEGQGIEDLQGLLDGLKVDAATYFEKADAEPDGTSFSENGSELWSSLSESLQQEARRLRQRLVSLMGQIAQAVKSAPLTSPADQRDVMTGTKAMRAALMLREFYSWDTEILNDEDVVLGVKPAGQSEDRIASPSEAATRFIDWADKVGAILELVVAGGDLVPSGAADATDAARYRPGTAMWMNPDHPELTDVADAVKEVFSRFDIRAIRADDIEHEGLITQRILNEIKTSEYCFADLSGERPNVYYEVGYAHALSRRVFLYRNKGTGMHFDLAGYNCPEYENLRDLRDKLTQRLRAVTNREPRSF